MPALGGDVISARWPFPSGAIRSMMRVVRPPDGASSLNFSCGIERRQVVEDDAVAELLGRVEVDRLDLEQREVALAVLGRADLSADRVAGAQAEAADLRRRDVDVVGAREVVLVGRAQEAEAVGQRLEHALRVDLAAALGVGLQDREDQILLAHAGGVLDLERLGELRELLHRLALQLGDVERLAALVRRRRGDLLR